MSNNKNSTTAKKVFKKDNILLGVTGNIGDIKKYLMPIFKPDFTLNERVEWGDYKSFIQEMDARFYNAISCGIGYDINFVIGGQIGNNLVVRMYCLNTNDGGKYAVDTMISDGVNFNYYYLGKDIHWHYFNERINEEKEKDPDGKINVNQILESFQKALEYGAQHDQSINTKMDYETLNRDPELLKDIHVVQEHPTVNGQLGDLSTMSCHTLTFGDPQDDESWHIDTINISPKKN